MKLNRRFFSSTPFLVIIFSALVAAASSWFGWLPSFNNAYYDFMLRKHPLNYPDDTIIIAIDEVSIDRIGAWPWERSVHARLLAKLFQSDVVVFDVIFSELQSTRFATSNDPYKSDNEFREAIDANKKVILPVFIEEQQFRGLLQEVLPLPMFAESSAALGHVHLDYDYDGITRGFFMRKGLGKPFWSHLSLAAADYLGEVKISELISADTATGSPYQIDQRGYKKIRFIGAPDTVYRFSYADVLDGLVPIDQLRNKRVFIGASAKGLGDEIPTPVGLMPGVEFYVNAYQAVRTNGFIFEFGRFNQSIANLVIAFCVCLLLSRLSPLLFFVGTFVFGFFWLIGVSYLFVATSFWFNPLSCLLAIGVFYPLWSWRRIEIALQFLREELAGVKAGSFQPKITLVQLQQQLTSLKELGLLKVAVLQPANIKHQWPIFEESNNGVLTGLYVEGKSYQLNVEGINESFNVHSILSSLLADFAADKKRLMDSYELVEQTIEEIYTTRAVAERMRQRMDKSMASLQDAVLLADFSGRIVFANTRCEQLFCSDLVGLPILALKKYIDTYLWSSLLRELMVEQKQVYQELDAPKERRLLCQAAMITEGENFQGTLLFVFTDVTQLRAFEQSKNEALAFLSHDMRSPIVSQLALIESFNINRQKGGEHNYTEVIDKLAMLGESSLKYAEEFLQLSRAENLDHEQFQMVDMHAVIDSAYTQVGAVGIEKNVDIFIERMDADCWIEGDVYLLERAIMNLLSNAIQYSPENGQVTLKIFVDVDVHVVIHDQGKGIDPAILPRLFEPYFRAKNNVIEKGGDAVNFKARSGNYGLGLSFVYTVVKRHGGRIKVNSKVGEGAAFQLSFPSIDVE